MTDEAPAPADEDADLVPALSPRAVLAARHDELTERAESWARGARADTTWAAYDRQWRRFQSWCAELGECPLPAEPLTVARFLADLAPSWRAATPADAHDVIVEGHVGVKAGLRPGTLSGYLAAISVAHQSAGLETPTRAEAVRRTMAGIRRHPGVEPVTRRAAARRDDIAAILATLHPDEHLADARDAALLLIGWKAALRSDDLARLQMPDLHAGDEGLSVFLRRSKTDQGGDGVTIGIATTAEPQDDGPDLDAGRAWTRWRNLLTAHGLRTGPAWRGIDRHGRRPRTGGLHRNSIRLIITRRADAAGYDASTWGAHSLRRGFATEAIARGVPERDVQRHGRWRSRASMDPYIDAARTFDPTNPTHWLT